MSDTEYYDIDSDEGIEVITEIEATNSNKETTQQKQQKQRTCDKEATNNVPNSNNITQKKQRTYDIETSNISNIDTINAKRKYKLATGKHSKKTIIREIQASEFDIREGQIYDGTGKKMD